jgi:hypothetical protein
MVHIKDLLKEAFEKLQKQRFIYEMSKELETTSIELSRLRRKERQGIATRREKIMIKRLQTRKALLLSKLLSTN